MPANCHRREERTVSKDTKCRRGLMFPEDSFCVGGGRYILAHDARGRIVVRDLLWQESDSPATFESLFRGLDEGEIPGFIASPALSANFSSPEGNFTLEESNTPATINAPDKRIVITSHRYNYELLSTLFQGETRKSSGRSSRRRAPTLTR